MTKEEAAKRRAFDLDVAAPDDVPLVLRATADKYREDAGELDSAHSDRGAGRPWRKIARLLDATADKIAKLPELKY